MNINSLDVQDHIFNKFTNWNIGERVNFIELFLKIDRKTLLKSDGNSIIRDSINNSNLWGILLTLLNDKEWNYQVWYVISQDKIILDCDHWSKELFNDDAYYYIGQLLDGEDYYDKKWCNKDGELITLTN